MTHPTGYDHFCHNTRPTGPELVRGEGVKVWDSGGNWYYDLASQTLNLNLGHRHPAIMEAVEGFLKSGTPYFISSRFQDAHRRDLVDELVSTAPEGLTRVNLKLCNGGDANEDAIKRARKHHQGKGRNKIVSQYRSHHGETSETISASGKRFAQEDYLGGSGNYLYLPPAYSRFSRNGMSLEDFGMEVASDFELLVKERGDVAGIIMELLQVDGGVIPQPRSFVQRVEKICRENDAVMIVDEVQTAFGWYGTMFASTYYGIQPDIISVGKALTSGVGAMSATLFTEKLDNLGYGESECTYGESPLLSAVALANMQFLQASGILATVDEKNRLFMGRLQVMAERYKDIGEARGQGLILGLEFVSDDGSEATALADEVYTAALANHLILRKGTCGAKGNNVLIIKPPLIISPEQIQESMNLLEKTLEGRLTCR